MATENKRVVAYLDDSEYKELKGLADAWGLSLSKAIARAVREVHAPSSSVASPPDFTAIIDAKVNTLFDDKVATLETAISHLRGEIEDLKKPELAV